MTAEAKEQLALELRLFGTLSVCVQGNIIPPLRFRKDQWILAVLALRHDRDVARDWLAATFWPDNEESQGLFYLRKALSNIRTALGPEAGRLQSPTTRTLRLDLSNAFTDIRAFDMAVARPRSEAGHEERLLQAVELYKGPLLQDCSEEWLVPEREARVQSYLSALEKLAEYALSRGEAPAAVRWLRLALATEPYRESAACGLMQALADSGDRAALQQVYQDLRLRLRADLNANPAPETDALYKRLLRQEAQPLPLPAPSTPAMATKRHLPVPLTDLIGREREIEEVSGWLEKRRLVTLLGPGGVGKTRLSIAAADAALPRFDDGAWFVDLAPLTESAYLPDVVAKTLGVPQSAGQSAQEQLITALGTRSLLLVLDNCEHLIDACATLSERLLSSCPGLRILATSRQALGVTGEQTYPVPSLALPSGEEIDEYSRLLSVEKNPAFLMDYAGIQLFVQRATLANPAFRLERHNASTVVEICHHLDGIPLAIEMAAARVRSLSVEAINGKLVERFRLLTSGSRGALPRQQTLRALIDWSYDLLSDAEKALLSRLSVFSGGWTLEAAEAICAGDPVEDWELLDLLISLVDKSLVVAQTTGTHPRYRLLETIRQYAGDQLRERGEESDTQQRHLDYFMAMAEEAEPELSGPQQQAWLNRLETEHDNFRVAMQGNEEPQMRLAAALARFWYMRGYTLEGRARYDSLLARHPNAPPSLLLGRILHGAGNLALIQSDYTAARRYYEQAASMRHLLGDRAGEAASRTNLATISQQEGNLVSARKQLEDSIAILRGLDDKQRLSISVGGLGNVLRAMGEYEAAKPYLLEAIQIYRELGNRANEANGLNLLGRLYFETKDIAACRSAYEEALAINRELGAKYEVAHNLNNLGLLAQRDNNLTDAESYLVEALNLFAALGARNNLSICLDNWAKLEASRDLPVRAAQLLGASEMCLGEMATRRSAERADVLELASQLRDTLGESEFAAAFERGFAMTLEEAVALATQNTQN